MRTIWVLGDQLGPDNAALLGARKKEDVIFMVESPRALGKLPYHQQRLVLLISASRHFAEEKRKDGWKVDYHPLEEGAAWEAALAAHVKKYKSQRILVAQPDEDLAQGIRDFRAELARRQDEAATRARNLAEVLAKVSTAEAA